MFRRVRLRRYIPLLGICMVASLASAQDPILHEYVPEAEADEALIFATGNANQPEAIVYDGEILSAPADNQRRPGEAAMSAAPGDSQGREEAGRRSPAFRPDRITELEGTLGYYSVFTPTITPFKRVSALDTVAMDGNTPVLGLGARELTAVPVMGATAGARDPRPRDRFWGSVVLDFRAGNQVPLPMVSPESHLLSVETRPSTALRFEKDGADNFYASYVGPQPAGEVRLVYLVDAPRDYFSTAIPDVASDSLESEARPLPASVQRDAETFARELGLVRGDALPYALSKLTEHFRSFVESDEAPRDTGNIYLDLARSKLGVCRHRTYAFMITALGLGIPTRFAMNEAHAWAEVKMAGVGWMRIDLGGAASGLDNQNADDRPVYTPVYPDPLPRPEPYRRNYSQLTDVNGLRPDAQRPGLDDSDSPGSSDSPSSEEPGSAQDANTEPSGAEPGAEAEQATGHTDPSAPADPSSAESRDRGYLTMNLDESEYRVLRGNFLGLSGTVHHGGRGIPGLRVEVLLRGDEERLLGVTVSDAEGSFRGSFGVPPGLSVGEYQLIARTPGNALFHPARAR